MMLLVDLVLHQLLLVDGLLVVEVVQPMMVLQQLLELVGHGVILVHLVLVVLTLVVDKDGQEILIKLVNLKLRL